MNPTKRILAALADQNCNPKQNGNGWSARCPAHEDRNPSLSISEGDDGRALVRCHTGCTVDAICKAIGLTPADLFDPSTSTETRQSRGKRQNRRQQDGKPAASYQTAKAAVEALERKHGKRSDFWTYHDAQGEPVGDACEPVEFRQQVEVMVEAAEPINTAELIQPGPGILHWKPFPVDALPEPVRRYVTACAKAIGCDESMIVLPLLAGLASAIGATRRIRRKHECRTPNSTAPTQDKVGNPGR